MVEQRSTVILILESQKGHFFALPVSKSRFLASYSILYSSLYQDYVIPEYYPSDVLTAIMCSFDHYYIIVLTKDKRVKYFVYKSENMTIKLALW